jgi:hypothetical protein
VALVVVLGVVAFGFSRGWFSPSSPSPDPESNEVSANQLLDQDQASDNVAQATGEATEPAVQTAE